MTDRLLHLEDVFPDLAAAGYRPRSEKSPTYNCIAFAAGDNPAEVLVNRVACPEDVSWNGWLLPEDTYCS
jgi:hypothetical protein